MNSSYLPASTMQQEEMVAAAPEVAVIHAATPPRSTPEPIQEEDPWSVWPYVWFIDLHALCRQRFHSLHRRFIKWRLERHNRRRQQQFWAQHGFRPSEEEMGLELL